MSRIYIALVLLLVAAAANAANVIVVTNNIYDLDPVRDSESVTAGQQTRITLYATDGVDPIDLSGGQNRLVVYDVRDNWELRSTGPAVTADADEGKLIWRIQALDAGSYKVEGTSEYANTNNNFDIFDIFLTVTNAPAAVPILNVGSTSVTNIFNEGAFSNTFNNTFALTNEFSPTFSPVNNVTNTTEASVNIYNTTQVITAGVSFISFTGAVDGAITFEGNAVTQTGTTFNFSYIETNAVTPVLTDTNVTGNWSIDLTQGGVLLYYQTGAITSQSFTVSSTNDVTASEVILLTDTNAITWNTNIVWAGGSSPTQDTNDYERFVFSLYRNKIAGGYLEDD